MPKDQVQNPQSNSIRLENVYSEIQDCDLLLYHGKNSIISSLGGSRYSHAEKALWFYDSSGNPFQLLSVGMTRQGGIAGRIEVMVREYRVDWYSVNYVRFPDYNRANALKGFIRHVLSAKYGYSAFWRAALVYFPVLRWLPQTRIDPNDELETGKMHCAQAVSYVDREYGGVDPVPEKADLYVEPKHLSNSLLYVYRGTLLV